MTAIPLTDLEGEGREKALERLLYSLNGSRVMAVELMDALRMKIETREDVSGKRIVLPQTALVEFVNLIIRVRGFFRQHGFYVCWSGRPFDHVFLEQLGSP